MWIYQKCILTIPVNSVFNKHFWLSEFIFRLPTGHPLCKMLPELRTGTLSDLPVSWGLYTGWSRLCDHYYQGDSSQSCLRKSGISPTRCTLRKWRGQERWIRDDLWPSSPLGWHANNSNVHQLNEKWDFPPPIPVHLRPEKEMWDSCH